MLAVVEWKQGIAGRRPEAEETAPSRASFPSGRCRRLAFLLQTRRNSQPGTAENASSIGFFPVPNPGLAPAHGCPLADDREALTRQVKEANDIVDVIGAYVALRQVGQNHMGLCPFHDDRRPSFSVSPKFQNY